MIHKFDTFSYEYDPDNFRSTSHDPSNFFNGGESDETDVMLKYWNIQPGETVIDVGAHIGSWTLPALAMGATHVYCFEPDRDAIYSLRRNLELNNWSDRATIINKALWHKEDKRILYQVDASVIEPLNLFHVEDDYTVDCTTLDSYNLIPDWIKIDVEGAELAVLIGAKETILRHKPKMIIEVHEKRIRHIIPTFKLEDIKNWLPSSEIKEIEGWKDVPRILVIMD